MKACHLIQQPYPNCVSCDASSLELADAIRDHIQRIRFALLRKGSTPESNRQFAARAPDSGMPEHLSPGLGVGHAYPLRKIFAARYFLTGAAIGTTLSVLALLLV